MTLLQILLALIPLGWTDGPLLGKIETKNHWIQIRKTTQIEYQVNEKSQDPESVWLSEANFKEKYPTLYDQVSRALANRLDASLTP